MGLARAVAARGNALCFFPVVGKGPFPSGSGKVQLPEMFRFQELRSKTRVMAIVPPPPRASVLQQGTGLDHLKRLRLVGKAGGGEAVHHPLVALQAWRASPWSNLEFHRGGQEAEQTGYLRGEWPSFP